MIRIRKWLFCEKCSYKYTNNDPDPDYPEPDSNWPFEGDGYEN